MSRSNIELEFTTIKNCGQIAEIRISSLGLNDGRNKTFEFLNDMLAQFAKVSTVIFNNTGDIPFWYSEKQLASIFLPAFHNNNYAAMQEIPTRRKPRGDSDSHAWLDYWVQKDDNIVYLIEVKHGWMYFGSDSITKENSNKIVNSIEQLKCIRKAEQTNLLGDMLGVKMSVMVLPIWNNVNNIEAGEISYTKPQDLANLVIKKTKSLKDNIKPNWIGIWSLPKDMQFVYECSKVDTKRVVPGICIFAKIIP